MGKINQHISNWRNGEAISSEELMISGMKIRIVKKIADGGYSSVFLAEEVKEWNEQEGGAMTKGQQFALKKVICGGNEQLEEAKKEIRVMKRLEHKHLLPIKGYLVQESGVVYMLFDLYVRWHDDERHDIWCSLLSVLLVSCGLCILCNIKNRVVHVGWKRMGCGAMENQIPCCVDKR